MRKTFSVLTIAALPLVALVAGCNRGREEYKAEFEPNLVHAMKYQIKNEVSMDQALADTTWIINGMFGTPDEPKMPEVLQGEDYEGLVDMDRLAKAAGPVAEGSGLYRQHCVSCHGITGNGRGENSAILDPYPRDYRMGLFKWKSTARGEKPTRDDLIHVIGDGIDGTAMKKIPELSADDVEALVDYVIYLSLRGELERTIIDESVFELDFEVDRIVNVEFGERLKTEREAIEQQVAAWEEDGEKEDSPAAKLAEQLELYDDSMGLAEELAEDIAGSWLDAEDEVVEVPDPPEDIPVPDSHEEFVQMQQGDDADALAASVARGKAVFTGKVAGCNKCHGNTGKGDGQNKDYDDWTKDWTSRVGLKPEDFDALIPLMARGAMPPKNARPRNFTEGVFRGGSSREDLYRRISQGIEGTPMPAASTFVPGEYEEDDIWNLINFIRSLQETSDQETPAAEGDQPAPEMQAAR
ncbi:cytochrome c [Rhodopirellula sp. MGV]|uniref:cytochrome c n=1 Tax=Rhodopirellula sp. MGV TaxID=2023130 RepID=UPI000B97A919|nr:cytochrome c [Rhodopirellula sp. MGV]OYP28341.1 cytochrome C [Rhodopirellula sp. MGV]PNY38915.1 cytochrome C [Rhodopirellula baltica]